MADNSPGRSCPLAYRYDPASLCQAPEPVSADVLYIVGGLYGNPCALDEIERMARQEAEQGRQVQLVFNGDFNWFNTDDHLFREINQRVLGHTASLGNVEYELANPAPGAGCGCAYPEQVEQSVVERSNRIMTRLQAVAGKHPDILDSLRQLPRTLCLVFGGLRILVLHGDPESLAGWGLSRESFSPKNNLQHADWFRKTGADIIVSSHTCMPALWSGMVDGRPRVIANNGSAGMANLQADPRGLITRIGFGAPGSGSEASTGAAGVTVSLCPTSFDTDAWLAMFDRLWPPGSDAALSYRQRILHGTSLLPERLVISGNS